MVGIIRLMLMTNILLFKKDKTFNVKTQVDTETKGDSLNEKFPSEDTSKIILQYGH